MSLTRLSALAATALLTVSLTSCAADPEQSQGGTSSDDTVKKQKLDKELQDQLPAKIRDSGTVVAANTGSFPPYTIVGSKDEDMDGAVGDLSIAIGEILGIKIQHKTVDGLPGLLTGMQAKRYDLSLGPVGDFKERQAQATFVDYVQEYVVFAVKKGNPEKINDLASSCGTRIAVQAGGSAEEVIKTQAASCEKDGKPTLKVLSYKDQPSSILAVQSGRADAFFSSQAPLTYFVKQSKGKLELAGVDKENGFEDLFQGAIVPKDSELGDVLLSAMEELFENGTYEQIMDKWGIEANKIDSPDVNLGTS